MADSPVVLCTAALFLSGYVIQQRTLRDLRAAIKPTRIPRPSPKVYFPDHHNSPSQLEDTINDSRLKHRRSSSSGKHSAEEGEEDVVIVRPTVPEEKLEQEEPAVPEKDDAAAGAYVGTPNDVEETVVEKKKKEEPEEKPISRAERRRKIKEEIRRLSEGQERVYYQRRLW
ncbi:hypothetical protein Daesc_001632 [Daldinia eschscholtzii]|uniref:Uncharacterized protein n=1 Tax=Daldinia eschscholtzii TaxID=292717 RepID=A0AAX6MUQ7_9PEZI